MNMLTRGHGSVLNLLDGMSIPHFNVMWGDSNDGAAYPRVDIREQGDTFVLEAELPGASEEDIDIKIDSSRLTIKTTSEQKSAEDTEEKEEKEENGKYLLRERRTASFTRSFALANSVDTDKIVASFKNGVLRIVAPKKEQERSKSIKVQAA